MPPENIPENETLIPVVGTGKENWVIEGSLSLVGIIPNKDINKDAKFLFEIRQLFEKYKRQKRSRALEINWNIYIYI